MHIEAAQLDWEFPLRDESKVGMEVVDDLSYDPLDPEVMRMRAAMLKPAIDPYPEESDPFSATRWLKDLSRTIRHGLNRRQASSYGNRPHFTEYEPETLDILFPKKWPATLWVPDGADSAHQPAGHDVTAANSADETDSAKPTSRWQRVHEKSTTKTGFFENLPRPKRPGVLLLGMFALVALGAGTLSSETSSSQPKYVASHQAAAPAHNQASLSQLIHPLFADHGGAHQGETTPPPPTAPTLPAAETPTPETPHVFLAKGETLWSKLCHDLGTKGLQGSPNLPGATASALTEMRLLNPGINLDQLEIGEQSFGIPDNLMTQTIQQFTIS